ncbi:glycosyl transferase group 1 [Halorhabdus utahensis DSM 12940]|uniref:Glycosyl transferase group 1 n=1 Tax=Halorhabdus utahensis (strain DSM 12940 / JCM 11049 / AX-2) TaxID=519442 RepID=C7NU56_HALUD|nr:glycosyltransferase family 4 protein [Halorhabdus utahensis]ACV12301.1 glycosyl transferase group 1 [Halorhabdus utahensis DSM 12940]
MNVLIVNKRAPFEGRGAEQVIWEIGKRFAQAGHQVRFFCPDPTSDAEPPDFDGIDFSFVATADDPTRSMIELFARGPRHYPGVYRSFEPDVVYDNPSPFPFHLAHFYGSVPVISKVHAVYRRLAFDCKDHPLVQVGTVIGEETYRLFSGETFVTNSASTAERLEPLLDTDSNRLIENPIGIDADEFEYHVPDEPTEVVTVSKLSPRKRVGDLLRAWRHVERQTETVSLTVAGSGPLEDELHELAGDLGLDRVNFPGYVSESHKKGLLRDASIYVTPTIYEGFGISPLEAMASGCAVVSSDTWGVKDYIEDGVNGRLVPTRSPHQVATAVTDLLENDERRCSVAEHGRATAKVYSMDKSLDREVTVLENSV